MPLHPGDRVGRIRIESLLGAGGMGEVYRGFDEKLERPVALKVVHAEKRMSPVLRSRFVREARVLSKLDHPNICRIYDVLEREDGDYLVLEFVDGETLRARLERPMTHAQALDIALQVAQVLAVTHARAIVHRDLKPDNIMITPSGAVKVLDFGLARAGGSETTGNAAPIDVDLEADDVEKTAIFGRSGSSTAPDDSQTLSGSLVGTLHYMSPEQARGLPISEASDIYSLGLVLDEMLSGWRVAYAGADTMNELLVRVRQADVAPFDFGDSALNSLVKRMLSLYPADRPTAEDVVRSIEAIRERPLRRRRRVAQALVALVLITALGAAFFAVNRAGTTRLLFGKRGQGKLAILPFHNVTGDASLKWAELGLPDLILTSMRNVRGVDVVPEDEVVRTMRDLRLSPATPMTRARASALLNALGADVLVAPEVQTDRSSFTIHWTELTSEGTKGAHDATSSVLVEAAKQMSVQLAQRIDPRASANAVRAGYSLDNVANMLYAMAMQELRTRGPRIAAHYLTVCLDRDPEFTEAKIQLADCNHLMSNHSAAQALLDTAIRDARSRRDQKMLARCLTTRAQWSIDSGSYADAEASAHETLAIARTLRDPHIEAAGHASLGSALWRQGKLDEARRELLAASAGFALHSDVHEQVEVENDLGVIEDSAGHAADARMHFEKAMKVAARVNDRVLGATVTGNLSLAEASAGNFARAEELTRRQLAMTRSTGDTASEIFALTNLGVWLWAQGKEQEAIRVTEEASGAAARAANRRVQAVVSSNLATAYTKLGDLALARQRNDEASKIVKTIKDPEVERDVELAAAYIFIREGDLDAAGKTLDRAERWQVYNRSLVMRARLAYARREYGKAAALMQRAKAMNQPWLIQYDEMERAFIESAKTGQEAKFAFESPIVRR